MVQEAEEQRSSATVTEERGDESDRGTKRCRDDEPNAGAVSEAHPDSAADHQSLKRIAKAQDVLFRIVVPTGQIGKVIGRGGCRIQKVREETGAMIKIADAIPPYEERVIIISSVDNDSQVSDAENALHHIGRVILMDDDVSVVASVGVGPVAVKMIRLLIAGSQVGSVIGISGQNIEKLRNSSGTNIMIFAQNQFPLCASNESDRLVQITGDVAGVLKALVEIGCLLRANPPRRVVSARPAYNFNSNQPYMAPASADYVTLEMMVPETMVGGLIGKCGCNISKIRTESGATIKVAGARGEQAQRLIQLAGSAQQVAWAKKLIDEYIYSQALLQLRRQ
ncbi:KH domain-containing protein At4g18375-like isoform X2 [Macadamia integrifolia]|uniref:KH domain-containing protein At4g18375-like isoform X2 n=1 Tax=Macadamia integrifolia TaxID=60698 RepID=UPI001C4FB973|nr:KH domain-containing protein At4g18375-like isoform X2 [Macadamia integrifolia]